MKIKTKIKINTLLLATLVFGFFINLNQALADTLPVRVYANDTVAGYASLFKTSLITPGQNIVFVVERPDGGVVKIPAAADLGGVAQAELFGHQTKLAGAYKVALVYPGSADASPQSAFQVHSDTVSISQSVATVSRPLLAADGVQDTLVTVTLYDAYRNPIPGHLIKLISSRADDGIETLNKGLTDETGRASFSVTSRYPGISVYTALDTTLNLILSDRKEVVFQAVLPKEEGIGGSLLRANLLEGGTSSATDVQPGPVDHFDIEDLPASVIINKELSITVVARDKNGNVAKNYTGTILISSPDDENALLPSSGEYTFKESDQGRFTFNLALRFSSLGKQTLQVFDKANWRIAGEKQVEVVSGETVNTPSSAAGNLTIKSPVDGAELGSNFIIISGQGTPNVNLKIFDRDVKIGESETDADGFFTFEAKGLASGSHGFYAMSNQGDVSPSINVQIDTMPPVLNSIRVFPEGSFLTPGQSVTVLLQSEPNLEVAEVRLKGIETQLNPKPEEPGNYQADLRVPAEPGSYGLDVILGDRLANKAELLNQLTLTVSAPKEATPPKVEGLTGEAGDESVTLRWEAVKNHSSPIARYRIYYGTQFDNLGKTLETEGAVTSFKLSNLQNESQTFFAVRAVDSKGTESKDPSVTVALTPKPPTVTTAFPPLTSGDVQATALPGAVHLTWQPLGGAFFYKIYFGVQSRQYDDFLITSDNTPAFTVSDLINNLPYYFAMVALDINGNEISTLSAEVAATPGTQGLYGSAPSSYRPQTDNLILSANLRRVMTNEKTGPEAFWVILAVLLGAQICYFGRRRVRIQ